RLQETYFSKFPQKYFSGDGAYQEANHYYKIIGRVDDVINVSGHRLGTAELESALVKHPKVMEAAVVGFPHEVKGQGIYAFITLAEGVSPSDELKKELTQHLVRLIGPIVKPDHLQWAPALPKTRSGKIMRRILRNLASGDFKNLGDTSTLADSTVVEDLVKGAKLEKK
ncbi:MAG: acetyl-coenzyme A synthetase, partial [Deltaproteobacteria bacterium]|nr:acetyl-coenzyme A synthetase [Deltaproteobacteria bacterium]